VGEQAAVLYEAPSDQGRPHFVASRFYTSRGVAGVKLEPWTKVSDGHGEVEWVEKQGRWATGRTVIVTVRSRRARRADLRSRRCISRPTSRSARGRHGSAGRRWVRVRHRDGQQG